MKIIAFDCFDTLFHRDCNAECILFEWAREIGALFSFKIPTWEIYKCRKETETNLRKKAEDFSYYDLIEKVYDNLIKKSQYKDISKNKFVSNSLKYELELEKKHLYIDKKNLMLLKNNYNQGNKIIIISDFYLPNVFFYKILENFSISKYIDDIFVSSEIGKRKSTGHMYEYILDKYHITPDKLTMIGDNRKSDFLIPQKMGINTVYVPNKEEHFIYTPKKLKKYIFKISKPRKDNIFSGYTAALILFCDKLYRAASLDKAKKLLFCAREGQNLKVIFDIFQNEMYPNNIISTEYFYVSRKATLAPSLNDFKTETFDRIFRQYKEIIIEDFFLSIGLKNEDIALIKASGINIKAVINKNSDIFEKLAHNQIFINIYEKNRNTQKALFYSYIKKINSGQTDKIFLVDIGWRGTIQDNIYEFFERNTTVVGYYFGLFEHFNSEKNIKKGLMFDNNYTCKDIYSYNHIDLERIFAANHGQTLGYSKDYSGVVKPEISLQEEDTEIFTYVSKWQENMNEDFKKLCKIFSISILTPIDLYDNITLNYLKNLCCFRPKYYNIYLTFRKKAKENFGNISGKKLKVNTFFEQDKNLKKKYLFVDYSYRLLDKLHMKILHPLAWLYCRLIYIIKKINYKVGSYYERKFN